MESKKNWIGKLLTEFISVVFAVLLALGLNHWREVAAEEKLAEKALMNIFLELKTNQKDVEAELIDYENKIKEVSAMRDGIAEGLKGKYSLGFNIPLLNNSAWNVANSTGAIKDFDMDLLLELSDLYAFQEMYQQNGISYLQSMNSLHYKDENNLKAVIKSNLDQLKTYYAWSEQLANGYADFIKEYGPQHKHILPDSVIISE